jgi:hypothetical protein
MSECSLRVDINKHNSATAHSFSFLSFCLPCEYPQLYTCTTSWKDKDHMAESPQIYFGLVFKMPGHE